MKNIERPEVQKSIAFDVATCFANTGESLIAHAMNNKESRILPSKVFKWLNSEYTEPHKWEPWELEAMKHIDKKYTSIEYVEGYVCVTEFGRDEKNLSLINFPSIKEGDLIYIDEELERNGMNREDAEHAIKEVNDEMAGGENDD